jgi:hypothetical protein
MASCKEVDYVLQTDASTSIGGGGWLARAEERNTVLRTAVIRWSEEEHKEFQGLGLDKANINVLEFFVAAILVIAWSDKLEGKKVLVRVDNTSAMKWIKTTRFTRGASWADKFMSMFSVYCAIRKIFIVSEHVPGVDNNFADELSRDVSLQEHWLQEDSKEREASKISFRGVTSRAYFRSCVTNHCPAPLREVLCQVELLLSSHGSVIA